MNSIKKLAIHIVMLSVVLQLSAQKAELFFPQFAGKQYEFYIFKGTMKDTISTGIIGTDGHITLSLPDSLKEYRGMSNWKLKNGGGLNLIFAGEENFSVTCKDEQPSETNIIYKNTLENDYLKQYYKKQKDILAKASAMSMMLAAYDSTSTMYTTCKAEIDKQQKAFEKLQVENNRNPLYAARLISISNFLFNIGSKLTINREESYQDLNNFVVNQLNLTDLWSSGYWNSLIENWVDIDVNGINNDTALLSDIKTILSRTTNKQLYTAFSEKLITLLSKFAKDLVLRDVVKEIKNSGRLENPSSSLQDLIKANDTNRAPDIDGYNKPLTGQTTLLVFYESSCGYCLEEMRKLVKIYPQLKKKGYNIISIAADTDKEYFEHTSAGYPWTYKLCDLKGFSGKNFVNYGILGTPTFVLINKKGIIQGKYAQVKDVIK